MPGYLKDHPEDKKIFAVPLVIWVVGTELVFYIEMNRKAGAWIVKKGVVEVDWWQSGRPKFPSSNKPGWRKSSDWLTNAAYFIGYLRSVTYHGSCIDPTHQSHTLDLTSEAPILRFPPCDPIIN